jgi:hypothetical protein
MCRPSVSQLRIAACCASLVIALLPLAAFAKTTPQHAQDELVNGQAQLADALQTVSDLQAQAQLDAANSRMIGVLQSEAMRQKRLNNTANGAALEDIANALAQSMHDEGQLSAQNDLEIAQNRAAALIAVADANVANAQMLAQTKGRQDELANALAQSTLAHSLADFITGQQAQINMANDMLIAQQQADAIAAPANANATNDMALGADELLASDLVLQAGELDATSVALSDDIDAAEIIDHAKASLANDQAMEAEANAQ